MVHHLADMPWWPAVVVVAGTVGILVDCLIGAAVIMIIKKKVLPYVRDRVHSS